ncbi:AAA family ATPase [Ramlibacter tataouinensis]|uniref:ExeA family protein n=1 Tax=Ramlibacter tataouinensis TaxID=94132 RepID=UPI0022F3FEE9|nr:ExeA family protein [Ramlibacter tataouinensis]WBY01722.1 AAA family ATPase [Ramlibacter tataouinensis]
MYAPYFGLSQEPFSIAPDPRYLFMSERHREALAHLLYGLGGGGGFVLLTGEIGTGKTTVCRCFLEQIPADCNVAYIFNPKLTVTELLQSVCDEFRIEVPRPEGRAPTVKDYLDPLNAFLLQSHAQGRNSVLIIDEAQNLSADVLEQLRLLTNLETRERKLLQIILIGQPELRDLLAQPQLEQLAQRVIARYHLDALRRDETEHYVRHRLEVAGLSRALPFERRALERIHRRSGGVPRRINLLCDRALLGAFGRSEPAVTPAIVDQAAREVFGGETARPAATRWRQSAALLAIGFVAGAGLLLAARLWLEPTTAAVAAPAAASEEDAAAPSRAGTGTVAAPEAATAVVPVSAPAAAVPPTLFGDEKQAWRELARGWQAQVGEGEPCAELARDSLHCFTRVLPLALIRQLDRPGIVVLDRHSGKPSYAVLTALGDKAAVLSAAGTEQTVTLAALAARWNGEWATLWRAPPGFDARSPERSSAGVAAWVGAQLAKAGGNEARAGGLHERIRSFQLAHGLPADGVLGPLTFMQLNRSAGVDEPRLRAVP